MSQCIRWHRNPAFQHEAGFDYKGALAPRIHFIPNESEAECDPQECRLLRSSFILDIM